MHYSPQESHLNPELNGNRTSKPLVAERQLVLDVQTFEWRHLPASSYFPDNLYGQSLTAAGTQVIVFGGWSNRAQNDLFVGEAFGTVADSVAEYAGAQNED